VTLSGQFIVIAKAPVPGRVKTRLTPPFSPAEAASLAEAALTDTLLAVSAVPAGLAVPAGPAVPAGLAGSGVRRVLALEGRPGPWLPSGFDVIPQRGGDLSERLAAAFSDAYGVLAAPMVLIGMDTPQVTPSLLASALAPLVDGTADAVFGPADDGGFWLLGLREPDPALIKGVPMSRADTGAIQLARLRDAGLRVVLVPPLTDVDSVAEAEAVAALCPGSLFATRLRSLHNFTIRDYLATFSG
jgi:rSAM/selenodomain-associated transferase 1